MTITNITFAEKKTVSEVSAGTYLKLRGELFVVAKLENETKEDPIKNALLESHPVNNTPYFHHRRQVIEAKYNLINFTTGTRYYMSNKTLRELLMKLSQDKFEVIEELHVTEVK